MSRVTLTIEDLRDATTLMQIAEHLDQGSPCVFAFDGVKAVFLPGDLAREGYVSSVVIDCLTPGLGHE